MDKTRMTPAERDRILYAVYQGLYGQTGSAGDNGIMGALADIKAQLQELNGQVRINTVFRKIGTWVSAALIAGLISLAVRLFGN